MANDLEPVVLSLRPDVAAALAALRSQGALGADRDRVGTDRVWPLRAPPGGRGRGGPDPGGDCGLSGMIPGMSKWNISGDALTIEPRERRSPAKWLNQNSLRIAVVAGLIEAVIAWHDGFRVEMTLIGVVAVLLYLNVRHRLPQVIRRPLWVVVMAQGIAGLGAAADLRRHIHVRARRRPAADRAGAGHARRPHAQVAPRAHVRALHRACPPGRGAGPGRGSHP